MSSEISADVLIPLVEQRSVIWDKTKEISKDKFLKAKAWREICYILNPEFDQLEDQNREDFLTRVINKWIHIRDAFLRSHKKEKRNVAAAKKPRPYLYKNQLKFLQKVFEPNMRLRISSDRNASTSSDISDVVTEPPVKKKAIEVTRPLETIQDYEHPQVSFIKGILPSLSTFTEDETLEFQSGVLDLVRKIKARRNENEYETSSYVVIKTEADC